MLTALTAPTTEPVTLAEAKAHLRLQQGADDALVGAQIAAAREFVEQATGRALAAATYRYAASDETAWSLPLWRVAEITSATYANRDDERVDLPAYTFDADRNEITLDGGVCLDGDRVTYEFATAAPAVIPPMARALILLLVADMYENAEANVVGSIVAQNPAVERLIAQLRVNQGV